MEGGTKLGFSLDCHLNVDDSYKYDSTNFLSIFSVRLYRPIHVKIYYQN